MTESRSAGDILNEWFSSNILPRAGADEGDRDRAELFKNIHKVGMKLPMSWEALHRTESRYGTYVPTGNKFLQRVHWAYGLALYKTWRWLEKRLDKNRHFHGVSGYEWEDAEYREFKQTTKWVETEIQEEEND